MQDEPAVDAFIAFDDEDFARLTSIAKANGRSFEEEIRKRIYEGVGHEWQPLTPADIVDDSRPHLMLDLRRPR